MVLSKKINKWLLIPIFIIVVLIAGYEYIYSYAPKVTCPRCHEDNCFYDHTMPEFKCNNCQYSYPVKNAVACDYIIYFIINEEEYKNDWAHFNETE